MLEHLIHFIGRVGHWGYLVIFIGVTLECAAFFFLPGESLVVIGGFYAARGQLDLRVLTVIVSVGAILGYCLGFELGRGLDRARILHLGRWVGLRERHFHKAETFFTQYGGRTVLIGRFTWVLRAFGALVAGSSKMPYRRFLFYNALGGILWSVGFLLLGYFVGASWPIIVRWIGRTDVFLGIILILVGEVLWVRRKK
jgi:membrane protein DedA with SNARE-associated domain